MVQVTAVGEWGFVTGGYNLQTWLEEKETIIQSDEHPVFLVRKPPVSEQTVFDSRSRADDSRGLAAVEQCSATGPF